MRNWKDWDLETKRSYLNRLRRIPSAVEIRRFSIEWAQRYLPHYLKDAPSVLHEDICKKFESFHKTRGKKKAIVAPRESAKSTWLTKIYTLYATVHGIEPFIILLADTATQSIQNLLSIRNELEENDRLAVDYPWACGMGEVWNENHIVTKNGVTIKAMGRGSKIRGRTARENRPSLMILDDIENDESVESEKRRKKTLEWVKRAVIPAGNRNTNFIGVGTALHREDWLQMIKRNKLKGWEFDEYKSLIKEPTRKDLWLQWEAIYNDPNNRNRIDSAYDFYLKHKADMDKGAAVLWPSHESLYDLMVLRTCIGDAGFESEKQGNPRSETQTEWPDKYFTDIYFDGPFPKLRTRLITLDPSKGESEEADYSAFIYGGYGYDNCFYIDADFAIRDTSQIVVDGFEIFEDDMDGKIDAWGTEINAFQSLLQENIERVGRERGNLLPTYGIKNTERKAVRIRRLTPYLRQGRIKIRRSKGGEELVDQLMTFPTGRYKDGPDALEMFVRLTKHLLMETSKTEEHTVIAR